MSPTSTDPLPGTMPGEPSAAATQAALDPSLVDPGRELTDEEIAALAFGTPDASTDSELSDDEIAALLSGGPAEHAGTPSTPVEEILAGSIVSQVSIQKVAHLSDRLRSRLTVSLRKHTADDVEIVDRVEILRYGDYIDHVPLPVVIGVAEAREWGAPVMVLLDAALIHSLIELLMGGRKNHATKPGQRQFTAIEHKMIERTIQIVLDDLGAVFAPMSEVTFMIKSTETNPQFVALARDSDVVIKMRYKIQIERRSGVLDIVLPRATLEPVREQLSHQRHGERGTADARWEERLRAQMVTTPVEVVALLPTRPHPVGELVSWAVGTHLPLGVTPETPVKVAYGGLDAWTALMGRKAGHVAVCLEQKIMGDS
jgi:flagellar motor switch protein FliM